MKRQLLESGLFGNATFIRYPTHATGISQDLLVRYPVRPQSLSAREIAVFINHVVILERALNETDAPFLVLESDVEFAAPPPEFARQLENAVGQALARAFHVMFIGSCLGMHVPGTQNATELALYPMRNGRCSDSLVWSRAGAERFLEFSRTRGSISEPVDWFLNTWLRDSENAVCLWAEPSLTAQGSMNGRFRSTMRDEFT